jgi:hypothetical protein
MSDEQTWYLQQCALRALRGDTVELPPDDPDSNVHSIELARTKRAIAMMRGRATRERPL